MATGPYDEERDWLNNRERRRRPKFGRGWCRKCDRAIVDDEAKCPVCGFRWRTGRQKAGAR